MKTIILKSRLKYPILACGADIKGAFALGVGNKAYLYDGFGDLGELDNYSRYEKSVKRCLKDHAIRPQLIACDLHPSYFSTRFAEDFAPHIRCRRVVRIQHHEAHIASAMAVSSIRGNTIGVAFDGTGYGSDGNIWGGEFFTWESGCIKRFAHLEYIPMPGGDMAIKEPWRMASAYLLGAYGNNVSSLKINFVKKYIYGRRASFAVLIKMMGKRTYSPLTSSMGRLFDAAASLILARGEGCGEAELPIELERIADMSYDEGYGYSIIKEADSYVIGSLEIVRGIVGDLTNGVDRSIISARFHNTIADIVETVSSQMRTSARADNVVLSGGVFQNRYLKERAGEDLTAKGFKVIMNDKVPVNDSGIPIGQMVIANAGRACV